MEERVFRRHNYWLHAPHLYLKNQMKNEITTTAYSAQQSWRHMEMGSCKGGKRLELCTYFIFLDICFFVLQASPCGRSEGGGT